MGLKNKYAWIVIVTVLAYAAYRMYFKAKANPTPGKKHQKDYLPGADSMQVGSTTGNMEAENGSNVNYKVKDFQSDTWNTSPADSTSYHIKTPY